MSNVSIVPPPSKELEFIIGTDTYNKICQIHSSTESAKVKLQKVDDIMKTLPADVLKKLPLPQHLLSLPETAKKEVHSIITDKNFSISEKHDKIKKVIKSQTPEIQAKCVPPHPSGYEHIPEDIKAQLTKVYMDQDMNFLDKIEKIHQLYNSLPDNIKTKLGPPKV
uniref:BLOC-1-related complex subunit 5 n=1 Tax=Strongyloides stercoralis TaxID=6248 RepID=A0A0K0DWL7_STRER